MKIDQAIASNALRLSVGRETSKEDIDLIVQDIQDSIKKILNF